jgi:uncharacterized membrane protein
MREVFLGVHDEVRGTAMAPTDTEKVDDSSMTETGAAALPPNGEGGRDTLDKTFDVLLVLKGLDGLLELIGGIVLIVVSPETINHFAYWLTQHELSEDPHDLIARHLLKLTANLHNTQLFGAIYLLTHGLVKLVIVVGLLRREHWAYYVAFVFLGGFVVYQIYRMTDAPTVGLALLTVFDIVIIGLTWREYRRMRARRTDPLLTT